MVDRNISTYVDKFWRLVGKQESFPRSLESSVAWALPLAIIKLPHLSLKNITQWLEKAQILSVPNTNSHFLKAYLIAKSGKGIIFLDGTDTDDELRFSLAHEVAHFILDYLIPRENILNAFGDNILDVLDGHRLPTVDERLKGIFRGIKLGTYLHLIDRSSEGKVEKIDILHAEDAADLLALELLAPKLTVLQRLEELGIRWKEETALQIAQKMLMKEFGLPINVAQSYGDILVFGNRSTRPMREWLGI